MPFVHTGRDRYRFTVQRGGDPFSRAAEVIQHTSGGDIYRGDLSGLAGVRETERRLRRDYPYCVVRRA